MLALSFAEGFYGCVLRGLDEGGFEGSEVPTVEINSFEEEATDFDVTLEVNEENGKYFPDEEKHYKIL